MKIHSSFHRPFRSRLSIVCTLAAVFSFSACSKDPVTEMAPSGNTLRFEVATAEGWNTQPQSRSASDTIRVPESAGVYLLQGENPADSLFLHASVTEGIEGDALGGKEVQTRAMPVETATFYDSFGVLTSVYTGAWDETSCLPDYMYNVEVTKASGWTTNYFWPGSGNVRFFAYAPYNARGATLSAKEHPGAPTISYTVPFFPANQQDLLVAVPQELNGDPATGAVTLMFNHVLTAVRFTTGDDIQAGRISGITLKGVYGSGSHTMGSDSWGDYGKTTADFWLPLIVDVDGSADQEIMHVAATFMMLPQRLPPGASIEVSYTDNLTGTHRTLTASIAGMEWPIGKTVTYRISTSSISVTPTFTVTAPADFAHNGGREDYSVTSYVSVSRPGDPTKNIAKAWTAEFVEDDGNGGYNVIDRPEWVTAFTTNGNGGLSASPYTTAVSAQTGIIVNPHNEALQAAAPVSGRYDLSTQGGTTAMNTANCYVVNAPGRYSLPLVYGNAIKNGSTNSSAYTSKFRGEYVLETFVNHLNAAITDPYINKNANCKPADATLVWQDEENLVTNVALSADKQSLTFEVGAATIRQGNAIVAVRDASGTIMWSWHIWVTDYVPGLAPTVEERYDFAKIPRDKVVTNFQNVRYTFMGVNVGWCDAETTIYDARSVKVRFTQTETGATQIITLNQKSHAVLNPGNNPYFQFGRKDPMLPGICNTSGSVVDKGCYSAGYAFDKSGKGKVAIGTSIQNPHIFYNNDDISPRDWCSASATISGKKSFANLWSANHVGGIFSDTEGQLGVKTIYDPSPVGYILPPPSFFTGFTSTGEYVYGSYYGTRFNSPYTSYSEYRDNFGFEFYCNKMNGEGNYDIAGGTILLPAMGVRDCYDGSVVAVTLCGYYWQSLVYSDSNSWVPCFTSSRGKLDVNMTSAALRSYGFSVRPVRE